MARSRTGSADTAESIRVLEPQKYANFDILAANISQVRPNDGDGTIGGGSKKCPSSIAVAHVARTTPLIGHEFARRGTKGQPSWIKSLSTLLTRIVPLADNYRLLERTKCNAHNAP